MSPRVKGVLGETLIAIGLFALAFCITLAVDLPTVLR